MRRKLIKQGVEALTVTLPAKWAKSNNLAAGDEIEINEEENNIIISSTEEKKEYKITHLIFNRKHLHLAEKNELKKKHFRFIRRMLSGAYKLGYDEIRVISDDHNILEYVQKQILKYVGHEIIDEGKDFILAKSYTDLSEEKFDALFNRLFHIIEQLSAELVEILKENNLKELERILDLRRSHSRLADLCKRIVIARNDDKAMQIYPMVLDSARIFREYKRLSYKILKTKSKVSPEIIKLMSDIHNYVKLCNSFIRLNKEEILINISDERNKFDLKIGKLLKQEPPFIVYHLHNVIIRYYDLLEPSLLKSDLIKPHGQKPHGQ